MFASFSALLKVCERKPECASKFLLADDDPHVLRELDRALKEALERKDAGYALQRPLTSPAPPLLKSSPWFSTLTKPQQDALCSILREQPGNHFFRDIRPGFGKTRVSSRGVNGEVIASACTREQKLMIFFDADAPTAALGPPGSGLDATPRAP